MSISSIPRDRLLGDLPSLICAVGESEFECKLIWFLNELCGAEHCTIFQLGEDALSPVASASLDGTDTARRQVSIYMGRQCWRRDPTLQEAQRRIGQPDVTIHRMNVAQLRDRELREMIYGRTRIRDRLLLCGQSGGATFGISMLRCDSRGAFSSAEIADVHSIGETLLAIVAKHAGARWRKSRFATSLTSLEEIEYCIVNAPERLPRREAEVCARILYGLTTLGIALDLGIGNETVMTYRKRAYDRLRVASYRELLLWYIALWSSLPLTRVITRDIAHSTDTSGQMSSGLTISPVPAAAAVDGV